MTHEVIKVLIHYYGNWKFSRLQKEKFKTLSNNILLHFKTQLFRTFFITCLETFLLIQNIIILKCTSQLLLYNILNMILHQMRRYCSWKFYPKRTRYKKVGVTEKGILLFLKYVFQSHHKLNVSQETFSSSCVLQFQFKLYCNGSLNVIIYLSLNL